MIPSAKDVIDIARRREGRLAEVPFPVLLRAVCQAGRTVVVHVSRGPLEKHVIFDNGVPVDCESNLLHETLGRVLVAQGKLQEADYQRALATAAAEEKGFAETLVSLQLISSFDLFRVMQQSLAQKLLDVFAWREGAFRILHDTPEVESPLRVNVGQLIVTGVLRFAPQAQVDAAIGALVGQPLGVHPHPPTPLASLRLGTKHSRALQILKTGPRLDELMAKAGLAPDEVTRLVYALAILGVVAPAAELPPEAVTTTTTAAPPARAARATDQPSGEGAPVGAVPPAPAPQSSAEEAALRDAVVTLYLRHRRGDAFDLLGVPITADAAQVAKAYLELAQMVAPWRFTTPALTPVAEKAEELFFSLARAYGELSDGEGRARVAERRKRAAAAPFKPRADVYAIKTNLLDATAQFAQGIAHKEAGRYVQALPLLEFAADCDAQNALYRAEAAHCRFLDSPTTQGKTALAELAEALRMDPQCIRAAYYAGQIYVAAGELDAAKASFQHVLKVAPNDARARRALRDLGH